MPIVSTTRGRAATRLTTVSLLLCCLFCRVSLAELDLYTPAVRKLQKAYHAERSPIAALRTKKLQELLEEHLADARDLLAAKKRVGNIAGIATGKKAVSIFEGCLESLEKSGNFALPERVRRELRSTMSTVAESKKAIEAEFETARKALDQKYAEQVNEQARSQGVEQLAPEALSDFLTQLFEAEMEPEQTEDGAGDPGDKSGEDGSKRPEKAIVIASSGEAADWVSIGRWFAGVSSIEMIDLTVTERKTREHREMKSSSPLGQPFEMRYEPTRALPPGLEYKFQIKSIPGYEAPSIVSWPAPRNNWTMQLRARPRGTVPSRHGAEILVSFPGAKELTLISAEQVTEEKDDGVRVTISITTVPEGAVVYVDGRPFRKGNRYLKTPCEVPVRPGKRNIRMRKFGFKDVVLARVDVADGLSISRRMLVDPDIIDRTIKVSGKRWVSSGVRVRKGDKLNISATGSWSCGRGKEKSDANGYPNDKVFYKYYTNPAESPRQVSGKPYGMLLMRIGTDGGPRGVGRAARMAATSDGTLWFDVNEDEDARFRRDNGGALTVRIRKMPGK